MQPLFQLKDIAHQFFRWLALRFQEITYAKKPLVFQAASFVYAAFIVWSNERIFVYLHVFVIELPFFLARI